MLGSASEEQENPYVLEKDFWKKELVKVTVPLHFYSSLQYKRQKHTKTKANVTNSRGSISF